MSVSLRRVCVLLGILMLVVLAGCGTAKRVSVTQDQNGSSVTVPKNGTLQVSLLANPSTGYSWTVVDDAGGILKSLGAPSAQAVDPSGSSAVVGMSERQTFQFDAVEAGTGKLTMEYRRAGDATVPAEQTFTLDVTVD